MYTIFQNCSEFKLSEYMNTEYHHNFHSSALDKKKVNGFLKLRVDTQYILHSMFIM